MTLLLIVLIPLLGALLVPVAGARGRMAAALMAGALTATALGLLLSLAPQVFAGEVLVSSWAWMADFGLYFSFRLDGLGLLFALLILGIGLLVILYATYYLSPKDSMSKFFAFMMLFMGAMLGVVLSENLILLLIFWELT
ncbi:Na(+) H(+) antiporter subunit A / Na(+) H(+) antiporter subunit B, partial [hydrothermal vent metagenome]